MKLVGLCDLDLNRARTQAARFGAEQSCREVADLFRMDLDLVDIVTPTPTHCELAVQALQSGCNVTVEKPMAASVAECERMIQAARDAGRVLSVIHNKRFFASIRKLRRCLDREQTQAVRMRYTHYQVGESPRPWMLVEPRGIWWETLVHPIYITEYLMGEIEAVCAVASTIHLPVVDSISILCRTRSGPGYLEFDRTTQEHVQEFEVLTEDGVRFDGEVMPDYLRRRGRPYRSPMVSAWRAFVDDLSQPGIRWRPILTNALRRGPFTRALPYENTFETLIEQTLDYLQGLTTILPVPAEEGLASIRVLEAVGRSLESRAWERVQPADDGRVDC